MGLSPLLNQLMVAVSSFLAAFSIGGAASFPMLLMEHFRSQNTSTTLDDDTKSWIGSINGLTGIPAILSPIIAQTIGRKFGYIITCMYLIIGWIIAITARDVTELLISESFHGLGTNSIMQVCFLGVTEMLAPKYRFVTMQMYALTQVIGMAACGIMGQFLHYQTVSIVMLFPILTAVTIALLFWYESPYWLAYKGKFTKCEKVFVKLRGEDEFSNKELKDLVISRRENLRHNNKLKAKSFGGIWRKISRRDFYMPIFHIFVLLNMMYWSGSDVFYIYFIELVARSTNNENSIFFSAIAMYVTTIVGYCISNYLVVRFKNKTVLLSSACGVLLFLICGFTISLLQDFEVLAKNSSFMMYCLLAIIACNSLGMAGMVFMISTEIIPVKHRNIVGALYITFTCTLYSSSLKLFPYITLHIGMYGIFLVYIINILICGFIIWKYVPETKNKTLQEIEYFYMHGRFTQWTCNCDDADVPLNIE